MHSHRLPVCQPIAKRLSSLQLRRAESDSVLVKTRSAGRDASPPAPKCGIARAPSVVDLDAAHGLGPDRCRSAKYPIIPGSCKSSWIRAELIPAGIRFPAGGP